MKKNVSVQTQLLVCTWAVLSIILSSCASMSSLQTARTTPVGEFGYGVGGGYVKSEIQLGETDSTQNLNAPFVEVSTRYGLTDKLDVGARLTIIGTGVVDAKYQFLGDQESVFAGSAGLGLGHLSINSGDTKSRIYDVMVPLYFSVHPTEWFSAYASPRYVYRINSYTTGEEKGSSSTHWYGATGGIRVGKKFGAFLEYSRFGNSDESTPFSQVTGGISIGIY